MTQHVHCWGGVVSVYTVEHGRVQWYDILMDRQRELIKQKVQSLRRKGKTYREIVENLNLFVPKSTLSGWCKEIILSDKQQRRIEEINQKNFTITRLRGIKLKEERRKVFYNNLNLANKPLFELCRKDLLVKKVVLVTLYLAEGSKTRRGSLMFGNSDPKIVRLFVNLMRECYKIDESKFRCTVQCRADQNIKNLETFWSHVTKIPSKQFYTARVDKRTIGQKSRKLDYKGVCRIDYFSSVVDLELKYLAQKIMD